MGRILAVVFAVAVVVSTAAIAAAQSSGGETPSCASNLVACVEYLNATTTPPSSCCDPLREAITNERACLCSIYNNPSLTQAFHINITQALALPRLCRIDTGGSPDICRGVATSPSGSSTPSGRTPSSNGARKIRGAGLAAISIMFGACSILY